MNLHQKLIEVRKVVPYLQKENAGSQYKYVSSSQVLANVKAKMDELGLLLIPSVTGHILHESTVEFYDKDGRVNKRTTTYFTELDMTMTWVNAEKPDEKIECSWYGQGVDIAGEKGVGKAMTYAEKYFMLKFFNIATDKDDPDTFQKKHDDDKEPENGKSNSNSSPPPPKVTQGQTNGNTGDVTQHQLKKITELCGVKSINAETGEAILHDRYKKKSLKELTVKEASDFIQYLSA